MADASKALQLAEGQQMMAHLQEAGVIGIRRSVRVRARHVPSSLTAPSLEPGEKLVHFQRHGQGYHNLLGEIYRGLNLHFDSTGEDPTNSPYVLSELVDPPLTQKGRDQCVAARAAAELVSPQKIIVSPLCRAVQTAILTFDKSISDSRVSVIAHEDIRESFGRHTCDKRRTVSESKREFRDVDFSLIATDEDTWWQADVRESKALECDRIFRFLLWLREQPETEMAVVGHSSYLFTLFNAMLDCGEDIGELGPFFATCEIRSVVLSFEDQPEE